MRGGGGRKREVGKLPIQSVWEIRGWPIISFIEEGIHNKPCTPFSDLVPNISDLKTGDPVVLLVSTETVSLRFEGDFFCFHCSCWLP